MNIRSERVNVQFDTRLDLTRNNADINGFEGFIEKNSPIYGAALSPLYTKSIDQDHYSVFDTNGHKYHVKDHILYQDDIPIMETKGNGYFTIEEQPERKKWLTYDKSNDLIVTSKYENGTIFYYENEIERQYAVSHVANTVIDCRSRIVNGTPITAYVLATPSDDFEFVYLSGDTQQRYIDKPRNQILWTNRILAETNAGTGNFEQERNKATETRIDDTNYDKGFLSPLINISNPLENVYIVSFLTNHGGRIDPEKDLAYFNIVNNNGVFYDRLTWKKDETEVSVPYKRTLGLVSTAKTERVKVLGTCYKYEIPSGWAEFDRLHAHEAGKYFKRKNPDDTLTDEIQFDEGYEPEFVNKMQGSQTIGSGENMTVVQYVQYNSYNYEAYDDVFTLELTATGLTENDNIEFTYNYTPQVKVRTTKEVKEWNGKTYFTKSKEGLIYDLDGNPVYKKKLILNTGTDKSKWELNNKNSYKFKPHLEFDGTFEPTDYFLLNETGAQDQQRLWQINRPVVSPKKTDNLVVYTDVQQVHEATIGERYGNQVLATEDDLWEYDGDNKVQADTAYIKLIYDSPVLLQKGTDQNAVYTTASATETSITEKIEPCTNTNYTQYFIIAPLTLWEDDEEKTLNVTLTNEEPSLKFTFKYADNTTDFSDIIWNKFWNEQNITATIETDKVVEDFVIGTTSTTRPIQWTNTFEWEEKIVATQIITPTIFTDDGNAITTVGINRRAVLPIKNYISFRGMATGIDGNEITYTATGSYETGDINTYGCSLTTSIDINNNYLRYIISLSTGTNSTSSTVKGCQILYDSADGTFINAGGLSADSTSASGWLTALYFNNQGSIAPLGNKWRILINSSGLVSGISYGKDEYIGTLLTEWNAVSDDAYIWSNENEIGYKSTDGKFYKITLIPESNENISIIFDRYIIVQTNGFWNCYDIERETPLHYATDFNNRAMPGISTRMADYFKLGIEQSTGHSLSKFFVSGINSMYEVSQVAISSIQISPQAYLQIATGYETFMWCKSDNTYTPQYIEIFAGQSTDATSATYQYSKIKYENVEINLKNSALIGLDSPVAIAATTLYSPNIFTEFVHTYNNKDLVKNGQYGYPIVYNETTPVLVYSSGKQISGVDGIFVIQSQFYALINGKIVSITYDDYSIIGIDAIIDISGMVYLGYLPTRAYFWSPANRSLYSFTGDANLSLEMEANKIEKVFNTYYSPQKEALFITTDIGTIYISDIQQYKIDSGFVRDIFFIKDGYFITEEQETNRLTYWAYEKLLPDLEKKPVHVETKYYGPGNGNVIECDRISIQVRTDILEPGEIQFGCATQTDTGFLSEMKTIKLTAQDFDNDTMTAIVNYTPKHDKGQGFKFKVISDYPIARITESVQRMVNNTLSKHNI